MIHHVEPEGFSPRFTVVGCFLERGGKFLLLHRQPHKPEGNTWGVPAGKVDGDEAIEIAIAREVFEETGVKLFKEDFTHVVKLFVRLSNFDIIYHIFSAGFPEEGNVTIQPNEHQDFAWVNREEALVMDLIEDEDECIKLFYTSAA
jgi:8-oxo-dGTP diphosphatase